MRKRSHSLARGLVLTLAVFIVLIYGGVTLFRGIGDASNRAQTELVEDAVLHSVVACYAVEGAYPTTLEYLKVHYGLVYDEESYYVYYDAFASNILPSVRVTERGAGK